MKTVLFWLNVLAMTVMPLAPWILIGACVYFYLR